MRRSLVPLLLLFGVACAVGAFGLAVRAQIIDTSPCEKACYDQKDACVSACSGGETDPVECESRCDDQLDSCLMSCR